MEFFVNELSLEGQFHSDQTFAEAVKTFVGIFSVINEKIKEKKLFKDSLFVNRSAIKDEHFQASFNRIKNRDIQEAFKRIVFNKLNPKDWRQEQVHSTEINYTCPGLGIAVSNTSVAETAERKLRKPEKEKILINFSCSSFSLLSCSTVRVIKEIQEDERVNIDVPFVEKKDDLHQWFVFEEERSDAYLRDPGKFRKTSVIAQGCAVYEERETRHLWYLDNFHKSHFEVFDRNKKHLGEVDLKGEFLEGTQDPKKDNTLDI